MLIKLATQANKFLHSFDRFIHNFFVGTYELNGNLAFSIKLKDGKLYRIVKSSEPKELKPESKNKLFYADGTDRQMEFVFDRKRDAAKIFLIADGINLELKKAGQTG